MVYLTTLVLDHTAWRKMELATTRLAIPYVCIWDVKFLIHVQMRCKALEHNHGFKKKIFLADLVVVLHLVFR